MSGYDILSVRTGEEPETELYPVPAEQPDTVRLMQDENVIATATATELVVHEPAGGERLTRVVKVRDVRATVFVTSDRVVVACSKYDKGSSATPFGLGAVPLAVGLTAVSKVRAARRRRGKMLVGHLHYAQLVSVGFTERAGIGTQNRVRLAAFDPTTKLPRLLMLDLTLSKVDPGRAIAECVVSSAADHRLEHDAGLSESQKQELRALQDPPKLAPGPKSFASYLLITKPGDSDVPTAVSS